MDGTDRQLKCGSLGHIIFELVKSRIPPHRMHPVPRSSAALQSMEAPKLNLNPVRVSFGQNPKPSRPSPKIRRKVPAELHGRRTAGRPWKGPGPQTPAGRWRTAGPRPVTGSRRIYDESTSLKGATSNAQARSCTAIYSILRPKGKTGSHACKLGNNRRWHCRSWHSQRGPRTARRGRQPAFLQGLRSS